MIMLFISKLLRGLSFSIFVITTPVVPFGNFLSTTSCLFNNLTLIFNPSILLSFGFSVTVPCDLKSEEVSNLPRIIFFDNSKYS